MLEGDTNASYNKPLQDDELFSETICENSINKKQERVNQLKIRFNTKDDATNLHEVKYNYQCFWRQHVQARITSTKARSSSKGTF